MRSLRSNEGYFMLDHSQAPGLPDDVVVAAGLPPGAGRGLFEAPTYTCSHCQTIVVMNPNRKRERVFCRGCNHLLCDTCGALKAAGARCRTFLQLVDEYLESVQRQTEPDSSIPLP